MMSASAPAGSASSISGKLSAASINATSAGDVDSDVISQPAPTSCIQVPMFETIVAIHKLRKSAFFSGLHAEPCSGDGFVDEDALCVAFFMFESEAIAPAATPGCDAIVVGPDRPIRHDLSECHGGHFRM